MNVTVFVNDLEVKVPTGATVLQAAEEAGVHIPTLCHHPDQAVKAACRVCMVDVEGSRVFQAACAYPVWEGMKIRTNTPAVIEARRTVVEMILSHHPQDCLQCERNLQCELQEVAHTLGVSEQPFPTERRQLPVDSSSNAVVRDPDKCINCKRCVEACSDVQAVGILSTTHRGYDTVVSTAFNDPLAEIACVLCGQCIQACPTGALREKDETGTVWRALADPKKHVVVQTAPAVRVALGEDLGLPVGTRVTQRLTTALRQLGFDGVFDTDFTADLTILEEGSELLQRIQNGGKLPMITSCSPGWIKYIEHYYPDYLEHLSTCKSPQQMFGALAKTYYAEKQGLDPQDVYVVSVMPCTAKKFEAQRPEMGREGIPDVDAVLTTRELARMVKQAGLDFANLPEQEFDAPLGISTGAAVIFGATGGVMEAALRTVYELVTEEELSALDFHAVRGLEGVREAAVCLPLPAAAAQNGGPTEIEVKVAVANSLGAAKEIMERVKAGKADYHFVEVMSCPGGCIGGGGQPRPSTAEKRRLRAAAIYDEDAAMQVRKSHENPAVKALYEEYLGEPLGHRSHELLHTQYTKRSRYTTTPQR